jgi:predicted Zn-ribbon and HTH transcriptional regulator
MNGYMKTTGKDYKGRICTCEKCGEVFESEMVFGLEEPIVCPKCKSNSVKTGQKTLASLKEELENRNEQRK